MAGCGGSCGGSAGASASAGAGAGRGATGTGLVSIGGLGGGSTNTTGYKGSGLGGLVNSNYGGIGRTYSGIYGPSGIKASYKGPSLASPIDYNGKSRGYSPLESSLSSMGKPGYSSNNVNDSKNLAAMAGMYRMLNRDETQEELRKYLMMASQYLR